MGSARLLLALVALSAVFAVWPTRAVADPMDLTLSRLYEPPRSDAMGNPMTIPCTERIDDTIPKCEPDQEAFAFLASQLGAALAPRLYAPARTRGYNGFYVGLEWAMTPLNINYTTRGDLNNRASVWQLATQGRPSDATGVNQSPSNQLLLWTVHARKGFPFGFELGTQIGFLQDSNFSLTRIASYGADIRWAPFEGYHRGIGFLPDLAVRGSINRMTGSSEMDLTIVGADVSLSKQIGVAVVPLKLLFSHGTSAKPAPASSA